MTTLAFQAYDSFRLRQLKGQNRIDFSSATIKVMVVTNAYSPNQATHDFRDDLGANEVPTATGYVAGGKTLANVTVTDDGAGLITLDCDDPSAIAQDASGFTTGRRFIVYNARGGAVSADELIGYSNAAAADFGNQAVEIALTVNASGLMSWAR